MYPTHLCERYVRTHAHTDMRTSTQAPQVVEMLQKHDQQQHEHAKLMQTVVESQSRLEGLLASYIPLSSDLPQNGVTPRESQLNV